MRVIVLLNISTEGDLANGTRGEVVNMRPDAREPFPLQEDPATGAVSAGRCVFQARYLFISTMRGPSCRSSANSAFAGRWQRPLGTCSWNTNPRARQ
ncbi:hypothetical protein B0H17DRAFT_1034780 [Mycena rosella]|uniref:Uncharacterized protein n=1 Tax=Mycena rosella TaxID=1033263 RepID=A0AAD7GWN7_MYCRO|nr:hypothetical protein B0H17DRAFT_1034780 [Mycena rosella]